MEDSILDCVFDVESDSQFFIFFGEFIGGHCEIHFFGLLLAREKLDLEICEIESRDSMTESDDGFGVFLGEELVLKSERG